MKKVTYCINLKKTYCGLIILIIILMAGVVYHTLAGDCVNALVSGIMAIIPGLAAAQLKNKIKRGIKEVALF